jgi:hypothetical protein
VAAVRNVYAVAERKDLEGWINLFTPDGVFTKAAAKLFNLQGGAEPLSSVPISAQPSQLLID